MRKKNRSLTGIYALAFLALLAGLVVLALRLSNTASSEEAGHPIHLSEIVASNRSYPNADGRTPDWIELHNAADYAIDLAGYRLTDNNRKIRYTFPAGAVIGPDGYYVVYCEKNMLDAGYADFAIDKAGGEAILLLSARSVVVDSVETVAVKTDEAMARGANASWTVQSFATPGFPNTEEGRRAYLEAHREDAASLRLSELQSGNAGYPDGAGLLYDWIELWNAGATDLDISGYRVSDKRTSPGYTFPDGAVVPAGGYFVLYCNRDAAGDAYARFSLSSAGGETVTLWNRADMVLDELVTMPLDTNTSMIADGDGWQETGTPSPGYENTAAGHAAYIESRTAGSADLRIMEVMPANRSTLADEEGAFPDWIELCNCGDSAASLAGWSLCDRADGAQRWTLPDIILDAGERLLVFASGKDRAKADSLHTNFMLSRLGESVYLFSPQGMLISSLSWSNMDTDQSVCADEASGEAYVTDKPTPALPNDAGGRSTFAAASASKGPLEISEVMTGNGTFMQQADGSYYDWVELKNISGESVQLSDYYLSDDPDEKLLCRLPDETLAPGALTVVLCGEPAPGGDSERLGLSLSAAADSLFLSRADGTLVDFATLRGLTLAGSYGRLQGQGGYFYFSDPTPGRENAGGFRSVSEAPSADTPAGLYETGPLTVALSGAGEIRYTLDGSVPTVESALYGAPLVVTETTVLRAVCIEPDKLESPALTVSYLIGTEHELPVVSVSADPESITGDDGLLAAQNRFDRSVERSAHIEYFDGGQSFSLDCAIKLHGGVSRERSLGAKHSYKIVFRPRYGGAPLEFPLFGEEYVTSFYSLLLRCGEDSPRAVVRDELLTGIARRESEGLLVMNARYCVLYLNGEYRGLYALKESLSSGFYAVHYGVSKESVDMHRAGVEESEDYLALYRFVSENDMTVEENYRYVAERIDLTGMADWCVYEAYSANSDIAVNVRYYRSTEGDGKWRYAFYDLDEGMNRNGTFHYVLAGGSNLLPRKLLKNAEFQDLFLKRMAYHLQHGLSAESVLTELDSLCGEIRSEMARERERWPISGNRGWDDYLDMLKRQIQLDRAGQMKADIADYLNKPLSAVEAYFTQEGAA